MREGVYDEVSYGAAAHMQELTGVPLAIGALMLARGEIHTPGVFGPEACIDPEAFLSELERRGVAVHDLTGQWPQAVAVAAGPSPVALVLAGMGLWALLRCLRRRKGRR